MRFASPFLCIWFLSSLPILLGAQNNTNTNINVGSTLTAGDESNSSWVSPSGDFAFGFQPVAATGGFLLAIWYNKIPDKTVTWSANRDELAQQGSKLTLTKYGLVLSDPNGNQKWNTTGVGRVVYAAMRDSGNLVLANESDSTLWQSFDVPTDTVLPTQILNSGSKLIARFSSTNYSRGRFALEMQTDGNLVLYTTNWPEDSNKCNPYYSTKTVGSRYQMMFNQSGMLHVTDKNETNIAKVISYDMNPKIQYLRAILEFDGVFRIYFYPRSSSANQPMNWAMARDFVPPNICNQTIDKDSLCTLGGGGACGFNSLCEIGDDQRPKCSCPPGYSFFDEMDYLRGCKLRVGNSTQNPVPGHQEKKPIVLIGILSLGSSVFLLALAVFASIFCRRKRPIKSREHQDIAGTNLRSFSYGELEEATSGFKEVVGQGAFATVYKGLLDSEEGKVIAVKKLNESVKENQREFESEVKAIAITGHRNLVQLIGFCNEEQHRLLVYEYMPNGSIADVLFRGERLNLLRRIRFAFEIARGLNYLHDECSIQIIHCDIKPQNILLDDSLTARISDFGLAKLLKKDQTHTLTGIRGTKGYVAPEWFRSMPITAKVDVYSYGILLLEIICCRRCFVAEMEDESQMVLADWAYDCYKEGRIDKLVEDDNEALSDIDKVTKLVMVALWCIQEDPSRRPSMNKVLEIIKGALEGSPSHDLAPYIISMNDGRALEESPFIVDALQIHT